MGTGSGVADGQSARKSDGAKSAKCKEEPCKSGLCAWWSKSHCRFELTFPVSPVVAGHCLELAVMPRQA